MFTDSGFEFESEGSRDGADRAANRFEAVGSSGFEWMSHATTDLTNRACVAVVITRLCLEDRAEHSRTISCLTDRNNVYLECPYFKVLALAQGCCRDLSSQRLLLHCFYWRAALVLSSVHFG